jgi:hypothetical protein
VRGGGGNFGVVTTFEYRRHPQERVLAGLVVHPWERARDALRFYQGFTRIAPDELTAHALAFCSPDGQPAVAFVVCYCGSLAAGEETLRPLRSWGRPSQDTVQPLAYATWQRMFDEARTIPPTPIGTRRTTS